MTLCRTITRVAVIGGLATGAALLVVGPERIGALASQARTQVVQRVDRHIQDPVLLRQNLRALEREYPQRIGEVRGELTEVREQLAQLERERGIAKRVVDLASNDLGELKSLIEQAEAARSSEPTRTIRVAYDSRTLSLEDLYDRATKVAATVQTYQQRSQMAERSLESLAKQAERLGDLLTKLETERATLQSQLWQLDGEIAMIERNEKLLDLTEKRQQIIDRFERFETHSLDHLTSRLAKIKAEQEARFEALTGTTDREGYEDRARAMLEAEQAARNVYQRTTRPTQPRGEEPLIIGKDGPKPVASR
ncbi:MAG: hypothetical protein EA380_06475 [Phycisphaeraceae bacterium]|nr:MAG: hypothetical protein EA380_06475 [Phycisphaeraceae bacterium]